MLMLLLPQTETHLVSGSLNLAVTYQKYQIVYEFSLLQLNFEGKNNLMHLNNFSKKKVMVLKERQYNLSRFHLNFLKVKYQKIDQRKLNMQIIS
jgi:hypothetical protein